MAPAASKPVMLLNLPPEIRTIIYPYVFHNPGRKIRCVAKKVPETAENWPWPSFKLKHPKISSLLFTCRTIYSEAAASFWNEAVVDARKLSPQATLEFCEQYLCNSTAPFNALKISLDSLVTPDRETTALAWFFKHEVHQFRCLHIVGPKIADMALNDNKLAWQESQNRFSVIFNLLDCVDVLINEMIIENPMAPSNVTIHSPDLRRSCTAGIEGKITWYRYSRPIKTVEKETKEDNVSGELVETGRVMTYL